MSHLFTIQAITEQAQKRHSEHEQSMADKLASDFIAALQAKFSDVGLQIQIKEGLNKSLSIGGFANLSPELQNKAIKLATESVSKRLVVEFAQEIVKEVDEILEGEHPSQTGGKRKPYKAPDGGPPPPKAEEYYEYLTDFVGKNLGPFRFDDATLNDLATRAALVAEDIKNEYGLTEEQVPKVARISLYDIVILCDNSGSMKLGDRIPALNRTLQGVAHWATKLEPHGISLRFLNNVDDEKGDYDHLSDLQVIENKIYNLHVGGGTKLGTVLRKKVIEPMVKRVVERSESNQQLKPLIAVVITDGKPTQGDSLRDVILDCKTREELRDLGKGATVIIVSQVGDDEQATDFLNGLATDDEVGEFLYRSSERLDEVEESLAKEPDGNGYRRYLIEMFLAAVDRQTA